MQAIYKKFLLMLLLATGLIHAVSYSQSKQALVKSNHPSTQTNISADFFIYLDNIKTRQDVLDLESLIQKKSGVTYFMAERYPVRCFVMRTNIAVTKETFQSWVGKKFPIITFGKGSMAREQAYLQYKKNQKITN